MRRQDVRGATFLSGACPKPREASFSRADCRSECERNGSAAKRAPETPKRIREKRWRIKQFSAPRERSARARRRPPSRPRPSSIPRASRVARRQGCQTPSAADLRRRGPIPAITIELRSEVAHRARRRWKVTAKRCASSRMRWISSSAGLFGRERDRSSRSRVNSSSSFFAMPTATRFARPSSSSAA